jgi:hypothetical protein
MEDVNTQTKRKLVRWQTSFFFRSGRKYSRRYFDVIDQDKKESVGHLVDLTLEGIKIVGDKEIEKGGIFNFMIDLPKEVRGVHQIILKTQCVWCNRESDAEIYFAGFRILSITPPFVEIIETLIES